jgi:hypothetical protein
VKKLDAVHPITTQLMIGKTSSEIPAFRQRPTSNHARQRGSAYSAALQGVIRGDWV